MIHLLFTGGTISMHRDQAAGGNVPTHSGEALVGFTKGLERISPYRIENWAMLPACHLGPDRLWALRQRVKAIAESGEVRGIDVERVVYLPFGDETSVAQQFITDQVDCSLSLQPLTISRIIEENPNNTSHTGHETPYGYVDWWPIALYVNHEEDPLGERDIRWALSHYINRDQVVEVGLNGAVSTFPLPLPSYPGLVPFVEHVSDILEEYDTLEHNPEKGDELMEASGWEKNGQGFWEKDGEVFELTLNGWTIFNAIGPVVAEQLRQNGIDAEYAVPPDWSDMLSQGNYRAGFNGHGGSVASDPYDTLRLFQSWIFRGLCVWGRW
jgi:peptide/nickel transport system substrate-binding protein